MEAPDRPPTVVSPATAEHYLWGGGEGPLRSDGWYLLRSPNLHIIEERLPPSAAETRHFHIHARQFFYVLEGELTIEIEHQVFLVRRGEGIEVAPRQQHQVFNRAPSDLRILVISQPPSHGDRTESP